MAEIKKRWYVLRVIGGKEKKVKEYIENEVASLGLQDYVSQVLIPTEKIYQVRNGKKISKERNFFPGYVMIPHGQGPLARAGRHGTRSGHRETYRRGARRAHHRPQRTGRGKHLLVHAQESKSAGHQITAEIHRTHSK